MSIRTGSQHHYSVPSKMLVAHKRIKRKQNISPPPIRTKKGNIKNIIMKKDHDCSSLQSKYDVPAIMSGIVYGVGMFAVGFALVVARIQWLRPVLGEVATDLLELPPMVVFCWYLSKQCLMAWFCCKVCLVWQDEHTDIFTLSTSAFTTLVLLESFLAVTMLHKTLGEIEEDVISTKGNIGIAAQMLASSFPMIQVAMVNRKANKKE